jgi:hypothetical protein
MESAEELGDLELIIFYYRLAEVLAFAAVGILVVIVAMGWMQFKKMAAPFRYFVIYLAAVLAIEVTAKTMAYSELDMSNLILLYPYLVLEFVLLSLMYRELLKLEGWRHHWIGIYTVIVGTALTGYGTYMLSTGQGANAATFQLYPKVLVNGSVLIYAVQFVLCTLRRGSSNTTLNSQFIVINNGVLLYFSGSAVVFIALNFLLNVSVQISIVFFLANALLSLTFYCFCLFALWKYRSTQARLRVG